MLGRGTEAQVPVPLAVAVAGARQPQVPSEPLIDSSASVSLDDGMSDSDGRRKRTASEMDAADDYDDEDDDDNGEYGGKDGKPSTNKQQQSRARRHNWQAKYEMEFGLLAIERDSASADVTLAMCGFCKVFGREGKYEQLLQADVDAGNDTKKRRRRSLTTTKFFRAFRVDNIRSHLQGAHPRRWAEYEMLPKQEAVRSRYLQMHGDFQYDGLPIDDVVLGGSGALHGADSEITYAQAQAHALASNLADAHHNGAATTTTASGHFSTSMVYSGKHGLSDVEELPYLRKRNNRLVAAGPRSHFDYEKHLIEQLVLDRERLDFEKNKFKKEVELREREMAQKEKLMEQQRQFQEKQLELATQAAEQENSKMTRLTDSIREALVGSDGNTGTDSLV